MLIYNLLSSASNRVGPNAGVNRLIFAAGNGERIFVRCHEDPFSRQFLANPIMFGYIAKIYRIGRGFVGTASRAGGADGEAGGASGGAGESVLPWCFSAAGVMFPTVHRGIFSWPAGRLVFTALAAGLLWHAVPSTDAALPNYLIDTWDTENGLPSSTVSALAQTPDGFLWVGTFDGLARYDGVRFVTFDSINTPALTQSRIQGLYVDANGTLWINTYRGGLTAYRDGVFREEWPDQAAYDLHTRLAASSSNLVTFVTQSGDVLQRDPLHPGTNWMVWRPPEGSHPVYQCTDGEGRLWFLTHEGLVLRFTHLGFVALPDDGGLAGRTIYTLAADAHGQVWAGAENEIAEWNGTRFVDMTPTNGEQQVQPRELYPMRNGAIWVVDGGRFRKMAGRQWVATAAAWRGLMGPASNRAMGAHEDRAGGMWFNQYGNGLFHVTPDGQYQRFTMQNGLPSDRVGAWLQTRDGNVWIGMDHGGLARLRVRRFQVIGAAQGLPARTALSVCEDPAGTVWIGTSGGGLCRWRDGKITTFPVGASASADFVFSIFPRAGGGLWLSAGEGEDLYEFRDGQIRPAPFDVHGVKCILADRAGRLWMGTKSGVTVWTGNGLRSFDTSRGVALAAVRALAETPDGTVWAGADDGTLYRCNTNGLYPFHPTDALASQPIYSLFADSHGDLWAGTSRGGLLRFRRGVFRRITAKQGLPVDVISQIQEDDQGRLWLGTHQGLYCVSLRALDACADTRTNSVDYVIYGRNDGLPALEFSDGYQPASWRGAHGRLWFATARGVVSVNPDQLTAAAPPPPVVIEAVRFNDRSVPLGGAKLVAPAGTRQYDFVFTAPNFNSGSQTRFRYRIDGVDADWVDAGRERTAHYGPLPPGHYRFRVMARNNGGTWSGPSAVLAFSVLPHFYQTFWFMVLAAAGALGGAAFTARKIAAVKYRRQLARLQQRHAIERDRARIAKDIHDDVGAGLTQITLLTELAQREPEQAGRHLDRIAGSARQLTRAMDEIVWAVDPRHDTLDGLTDYISAYAEDYLRTAGIRCRMDLPVTLPAVRVGAELRHNLFLALKEALNNVVKHAQAAEVRLHLRVGPEAVTLTVEDNGRGFSSAAGANSPRADRLGGGAGLANLEKRLAAIGGRCHIHSQPGRGTRVEMTAPFRPAAPPEAEIAGKK